MQAKAFLLDLPGFHLNKDGDICATGIDGIRIFEANETSVSIIKREIGVDANLTIWFRLTHEDILPVAFDNLINVCQELMKSEHGDAVLLANLEEVAMTRENGKVVLFEKSGIWRAISPDVMTLPHEVDSRDPVII